MSFFEWLGRVIMLVLAGMITLSIIGAIAAIPSGGLPERIGMSGSEVSAPPVSEPAPTHAAPRDRATSPQSTDADADVGLTPAEPERLDPGRWLEAITYALLALVGIAALATLILWRMLHQRRRIADALEAISLGAVGTKP